MPTASQGFFLCLAVFIAAFGLASAARFVVLTLKAKKDFENEKRVEPESRDPKIYYIKDVLPRKTPRKRRRRKPNVAFKSVVISPEEFIEKDPNRDV